MCKINGPHQLVFYWVDHLNSTGLPNFCILQRLTKFNLLFNHFQMARVDLVMPKMGESIIEATILKWNKKVGEKIGQDETLLEVATDKVDSEVPSHVDGVVAEILFPESAVVAVGKVIAIIETEGEVSAESQVASAVSAPTAEAQESVPLLKKVTTPAETTPTITAKSGDRFYSPLVRNIAKEEHITQS